MPLPIGSALISIVNCIKIETHFFAKTVTPCKVGYFYGIIKLLVLNKIKQV